MALHVKTNVMINVPVAKMFRVLSDPMRLPHWCSRISSAQWVTQPDRMQKGAEILFTARVLGREVPFTCEVEYYRLNQTLVLRSTDTAFDFETIYDVFAQTPTTTRMALHSIIEPNGSARLAGPLVARAIKMADRRDLARLTALLERADLESLERAPQ
jgi:uncharacterized membrane protein